MRLSFSEAFRGPLRELDKKDFQMMWDAGVRVGGISCPLDSSEDDIKYGYDLIHDFGFELGTFWSGHSVYRPDPQDHKKVRGLLKKQIDIAGKLGCTTCGFAAGSMSPKGGYWHHPENHTQKAMDLIVEHTKTMLPYAEDAGVILCPETTMWTVVGSPEGMKEFVERVDSPFCRICFDPVNHMNSQRVYESGVFIRKAISMLGDLIGSIHCKDVIVQDKLLVTHIDEYWVGEGILEHGPLIEMSEMLEPWKTFMIEHVWERERVTPSFKYILDMSERMGHTWDDPHLTRQKWEQANRKR